MSITKLSLTAQKCIKTLYKSSSLLMNNDLSALAHFKSELMRVTNAQIHIKAFLYYNV